MNENEKKNAIVKAMTEVECIPVFEEREQVETMNKLPLENLALLGASLSALFPLEQNAGVNVGETLYRMVVPNGASGVVNSVGNIVNEKGKIVARARYIPIENTAKTVASIDPTVMLITLAISTITSKLDEIQETQKEILEFLQLKEKAKLKGNLSVLQEILDEYKYNWNNEKFKNNKHIQVQEIKRDSEQSVVFCREMIEKKASKNVGFIHSDGSVKSKIQKIQSEFKDYELALYLYAFSSFLEVMLLENFDNGYLNSVSSKIELYANQCNDLYKIALEKVEKDLKTSVQAGVLKGVAGLNKAIGGTIAKIPKIRDGQVDENLIEAGEKVDKFNEQRTENIVESLSRDFTICVLPFVDNINAVNKIYNEPLEVLFDSENLYFKLTD